VNFKRYLNENRTALNWNNVNRARLCRTADPVFPLATAKPSRARSRAWTDYPSTIYTSQNHKNHAGFSNFYNLEQKGLFFEEIRESSTSFATERRLPPYDIYELKSQISRRNFIFLQDRTKRAICRKFSRKFDKLRYFSLVPRPPMTIFFIGTTSTNDDIFHWYHVHQ
jgi:hypothetical protein